MKKNDYQWISQQSKQMISGLRDWSDINSGTNNLLGLRRMIRLLRNAWHPLGETVIVPLTPYSTMDAKGQWQDQKVGQALLVRQRPELKKRLFLGGHMDTVFSSEHSFQSCLPIRGGRLRGPGVADMKGGLMAMLKGVEAFERRAESSKIGWDVLIVPDEEVGSLSSSKLLPDLAEKASYGLLYEPAPVEGTFTTERKGSGNFTLTVRGRASHVRAFNKGRNAVTYLSEMILRLNQFNEQCPGLILNVARVEGGGPLNIVPDWATCRFNIRFDDAMSAHAVADEISMLVKEANEDGYKMEMYGGFHRPCKPHDEGQGKVFTLLEESCQDLDLAYSTQNSGGCCDGNNLANLGLPNVDTMGVRGGGLHSNDEFMVVESLVERAALTAQFMLNFARQ